MNWTSSGGMPMTQEALNQTQVTKHAVPGDWAGSFSYDEGEQSTIGRGTQGAEYPAARGAVVLVRQSTASQGEWITALHMSSTPIVKEGWESDWTEALVIADWGKAEPEHHDDVQSAVENEEREKEIERIAEGRIELLARRYAGSFGREEQARLAMLSNKLDVLLPRITPEDYEFLEEIAERARESEEIVRTIAERYGID